MRFMYFFQMLLVLVFATLPAQAKANDQAGRVMFQFGDTWVLKAGKPIALHQGDRVFPRDVVVTGKRGRVKLRMVDDTMVYVGSKSRIEIKAYQMSGDSLIKGFFDMLWGKARFMVNKLKKKGSSFSVSTKTAVIGVRGTEFSVEAPRPINLTQAKALQLKPSLVLPKKPVTMMLFEGSVLGKNIRGGQKLIKPGILANFTPSGKILTRKITSKDVKRLGIQRLARPSVGERPQTPTMVTPLKASQPSQGSRPQPQQIKGNDEQGRDSTSRRTVVKSEALPRAQTVTPVSPNTRENATTKVRQLKNSGGKPPVGSGTSVPTSRTPSMSQPKGSNVAPTRTPSISRPKGTGVPSVRNPTPTLHVSKPKPVTPAIKTPQISKPARTTQMNISTVRAPKPMPTVKAPTMRAPKVRPSIRP